MALWAGVLTVAIVSGVRVRGIGTCNRAPLRRRQGGEVWDMALSLVVEVVALQAVRQALSWGGSSSQSRDSIGACATLAQAVGVKVLALMLSMS